MIDAVQQIYIRKCNSKKRAESCDGTLIVYEYDCMIVWVGM